MLIRIFIFFIIIFLVILAGYLAGQYFYSQKIKPQNISQTSLIAPLINEKKNINNYTQDSNQYVIIPKIDNKKENTNQNTSTIITKTTTITTTLEVNKTTITDKETTIPSLEENQNTISKTNNKNNPKIANNQEIENNKEIQTDQQKEHENNKEKKVSSNSDNSFNTSSITIDTEGDYYIQLGLFSVYNNAKYVSQTLKDKGIPYSIDEVIIKNVKMYRVIVGPFKNIDKANNISKIIEKEGFNPLVRKF